MNVITNNNLKCTIALAALENVTDPEIGLNVVDLGLIYQIDFDDAQSQIFIAMTLTTQFCPMGESITGAVKRALENTFTNTQVQLELTFDPPWSHELISEEGQKFLNQ
ncbi:MAG TPA: metal-sulfur cluster assembly factor [Ferruginibacter sp.]|nr:metal-sulfur cluster assembly factor [Ferruginibacter sp.]